VEKAVIGTLRKRHLVSFSEVLKEIFFAFPNALTPTQSSVEEVLEAYAEKVPGGQWRIRPMVEVREGEHSTMIGYLAEIGRRGGYEIWIGVKERSDIYKGKPLSTLCTIKKLDLPSVSQDKLEFVENIDLLWVKEDRIEYAFEIENTTAITEAVNRCTNIPAEHGTIKCIVIPEERRALLHKKVNSELLKDRLYKEGWEFIYYGDLERFFRETSAKRRIHLPDFDKILQKAVEPPQAEVQLGLPFNQ